MKVSQQSVAKLIQERQNKFIENRTKIETEVNKFLQSLEGLDEDVKARCTVKIYKGATAKQILPSLWVEPFSIDKYNQEKANFDNYVKAIQTVCDAINQEALECLQNSQ